MLEVQNVVCGYGGEPVLHDVSFSVENNEKLCILGPNGCGKTTLMRAICGILKYRGSIAVDGVPLETAKRRDVARRVALMSQIASIHFSYTVYETVMMGRFAHMDRGLFGGESKLDRDVVLDCLERTGTADLRDKEITELSGGQLQRVFLARTFAQSPQVILLDEPTNHLDLKYQLELVDYLREWAEEDGRCLVGVFHDINLALSLADSILLLQDGRTALREDAAVFDVSALSDIYRVDIQGYMRSSLRRWM